MTLREQAKYSAFYVMEDIALNDANVKILSGLSGLPEGVVYSALKNLEAARESDEGWQDDPLDNLKFVNRFEYIGENGRELVTQGEFDFHLQDDGETLKIIKKEDIS